MAGGEIEQGQLVAGFAVGGIGVEAGLQLGAGREAGALTGEAELGLERAQGLFVAVLVLDGVDHLVGVIQLAIGQQRAGQDQQQRIVGFGLQRGLQQGNGLLRLTGVDQRLCLSGQILFRRFGCGSGLVDVRREQVANRTLGLHTGEAFDRLTVLEQHHGRQAANAEAFGQAGLGIAVDLGQQQFPLVAVDNFLQHRKQRLAGRTPVGPEVDQHGFMEGVFEYIAIEGIGGGVEQVRR